MSKRENLDNIRHSLAHLLAMAVIEKDPNARLGIGPAVENGFYYDFKFSNQNIESQLNELLPEIEERMRELIKENISFTQKEESLENIQKKYQGSQPYKIELAEEFAEDGEKLTLVTSGDFTDLCRGGHVENTSEINPDAFALERVAGAYWRGDENNIMLTRIYGVAFNTKEELEAYQEQKEEALKRDHRRIGREMDLFVFSDLVGSGLPLFTPKGTVLRDKLAELSETLQAVHGFERVWIPHITKIELYKTSGHWDKFGDELMLVKSQETDDEMAMKPMNCPHHTQIYASKPRSYRDLPIRYMETTTNYRDEKSGELGGLTRVRSLTQDDGHVFCTMDQLEQEFENIMQMIKTMYEKLDLSFYARLSFRDPDAADKYLGDDATWNRAEKTLKDIAEKLNVDYTIARGEAAIYGPKIDIMVTDALGRKWQCATEQLDFIQPERFGLEYTDADGSKKTPVMIHKALLGTIERFLGVYIEHTEGRFPLWLSPEQVRVLPIGENHENWAHEVYTMLKQADIRVAIDTSDKKLGKKIHEARTAKVPYYLVIGDEEVSAQAVAVESRDDGKIGSESVADFLKRVQREIEEKS